MTHDRPLASNGHGEFVGPSQTNHCRRAASSVATSGMSADEESEGGGGEGDDGAADAEGDPEQAEEGHPGL